MLKKFVIVEPKKHLKKNFKEILIVNYLIYTFSNFQKKITFVFDISLYTFAILVLQNKISSSVKLRAYCIWLYKNGISKIVKIVEIAEKPTPINAIFLKLLKLLSIDTTEVKDFSSFLLYSSFFKALTITSLLTLKLNR